MIRTPISRKSPFKNASIRASSSRLKQKRSTPKLTPDDLDRFARMRDGGCVACHLNVTQMGRPTATFRRADLEIHHLTDCGRRRGHDFVVCLCHFHHQSKRLPFITHGYKAQAEVFGPSYEREKRRFREIYGSDEDLLDVQQTLLANTSHSKESP